MKNENKIYLVTEPQNLSEFKESCTVNKIFSDIKEGDYLYFEMPAFCSGEYKSKIEKDDIGFYVSNKHFNGCYGYSLKPYWSKEYQ